MRRSTRTLTAFASNTADHTTTTRFRTTSAVCRALRHRVGRAIPRSSPHSDDFSGLSQQVTTAPTTSRQRHALYSASNLFGVSNPSSQEPERLVSQEQALGEIHCCPWIRGIRLQLDRGQSHGEAITRPARLGSPYHTGRPIHSFRAILVANPGMASP